MSGVDDELRMTIGEHLEELRWHVFKAVGYVGVALIVCLIFQDELMTWATAPHITVMERIERDARVGQGELDRDVLALLADIDKRDKDLNEAVNRVERREAQLHAALQDSDETEARLEELKDELEELEDELDELEDDMGGLDLDVVRERRRALLERRADLGARVELEVRPLIDKNATPPKQELTQLKYQEAFISALKLSLVAAMFLASPIVVFELWRFVSKGLYPNERKYVRFFFPLSLIAFICGGAFGYYLLIPLGLQFLVTYGNPEQVTGAIALGDYLSLFTTMTLVVGAVFELPLVMSFLSLVGIVPPQIYRKHRRFFILGAFIGGALLTPPDPVTQILMAIPILLLYELGIISSTILYRKRQEQPEPDPPDPPSSGGGGGEGGAGPFPSSDSPTSSSSVPEESASAEPAPPEPVSARAETPASAGRPSSSAPVIAPPAHRPVARGEDIEEASPAEASPAEASPAEASAEETRAKETSPEAASAEEASAEAASAEAASAEAASAEEASPEEVEEQLDIGSDDEAPGTGYFNPDVEDDDFEERGRVAEPEPSEPDESVVEPTTEPSSDSPEPQTAVDAGSAGRTSQESDT
jgi:sec-independent protein translocase protein TatC